MHRSLRSSPFLLALIAVLSAAAQPVEYATPNAAIAALYPGERVTEWTRTTGDFNGDGNEDLALILTLSNDNGPMQTRLLVLAGSPGGGYSKLTASSKYCDAQKFFDLESKGPNLRISAVHKADESEVASETLHFQFNRRIGDLELIGREDVWEAYAEKSSGRLSVNYRTGSSTEYGRERGRVREARRSKFAVSPLERLSGFNCDEWATRTIK